MKKAFIPILFLLVFGAFGCQRVDNRMNPEIELHIKAYLAEKYDPNAESGFTPTTDYMGNRQNKLDAAKIVGTYDKRTVDFIRARHSGISDEDLIRTYKQFQSMSVLKKMNDIYNYYFKSINGCSADEYRGTVTFGDKEVSDDVVQMETVDEPC